MSGNDLRNANFNNNLYSDPKNIPLTIKTPSNKSYRNQVGKADNVVFNDNSNV